MTYDVIVVGTGGWGGAACWQLAARGKKVLGIDRFEPPHANGSSHGGTRVLHQPGHEGPIYARMMYRAYALWDALERQTGRNLIVRTGGLFVGPEDWISTQKAVENCEAMGSPYRVLSHRDLDREYPAFRPQLGEIGVFEDGTSVLFVERCVQAQLEAARNAGAELLTNTRVQGWDATGSGVAVRTDRGTHAARFLVLAAGAWNPDLIGRSYPLTVDRQVVGWFHPPPASSLAAPGSSPVFVFATSGGAKLFYGIPDLLGDGVKCSYYQTGDAVHPDEDFRTVTASDLETLRSSLRARVPELDGTPRRAGICISTNSVDLEYVIGRHPDHDAVVIATGDSGRGFQVSPVVGELIASLIDDEAPAELALFHPGRFSGAAS
jgi:sarcosine oxidase